MSFERITKLIENNGGQIAELDDAKLTHVILDKRDDSRRRELMKRTSQYEHIFIPFFSPYTDVQAKAQKSSPLRFRRGMHRGKYSVERSR